MSLLQIEKMTKKEHQSVDMEGAQRAIQLVGLRSSRHQRNGHQGVESPPTNNSKLSQFTYLVFLTYGFLLFSLNLCEFEVDPNTNLSILINARSLRRTLLQIRLM